MTDLIPRIRPAEVARITSLSIRKVQEMAASGKIPGAAKFDGVWTFDPVQIKAWIHQRERAAACPMKDPYANAATSIPAAYVLPDESLNEAFERATTKKRRSASKRGVSPSSAPASVLRIVPRSKP